MHHQGAHLQMGIVAARLAPAQVVALQSMPAGPVEQRLFMRAPGQGAVAIRHREVGDRLADIVQQPGQTARDPPARLQVIAVLGLAIQREDVAHRRLRGEEAHFQGMAQQPARAAVMMGLGGGQQVHEGGEAAHDRQDELAVIRVGHAHAVLEAADQFGLLGEQRVHVGGRQPLDEGRIAQQVLVRIGGRCDDHIGTR